jgi:ribosomal protein S18 acetylase RimI-like enzyme
VERGVRRIVTDVLRDASVDAVRDRLTDLARATAAFWSEARGGSWVERDGLIRFTSGAPLHFTNGVTAIDIRPEDADRRIEEAALHFDGFGLPWMWWVEPFSRPADLDGRLRAHGFCIEEEIPRLAARIDRIEGTGRSTPSVAGLRIDRVVDGPTERGFLAAMAGGFAHGEERQRVLSLASRTAGYDAGGPWVRFVGTLDDEPVASSGILLLGGLALVVNVATVEPARRRGIAEAMTRRAIAHASSLGYEVAVLGTSEMARSIYDRIGFVEVGVSRGYMRPGG